MVYFTSIAKTDTYVEMNTRDNELYVIPNDDVIFVDDNSGMVSVKNTGSRKTIGLIPVDVYYGE